MPAAGTGPVRKTVNRTPPGLYDVAAQMLPRLTLAGGGTTWVAADTVTPAVAVTVTGVGLLTFPTVAQTVKKVTPAGARAAAGTDKAVAFELLRVTGSPPEGDGPVRYTVRLTLEPGALYEFAIHIRLTRGEIAGVTVVAADTVVVP
jgi:hypothetical protein